MSWFDREKKTKKVESTKPIQDQTNAGTSSGMEAAARAREQLALESLRSLTDSLRQMKFVEDREEYKKIDRIRGLVAGKAGTSSIAVSAIARLDREAAAADTRISSAEIRESFQNIILNLAEVNQHDDEKKLLTSGEEINKAKDAKKNKKLDGDRTLDRIQEKAEDSYRKAGIRLEQAKKHYVADEYQTLAGKVQSKNRDRNLKKEDAQRVLAEFENKKKELDELRKSEYGGKSKNIDRALSAVESELQVLKGKIDTGAYKNKVEVYENVIAEASKTPLETLIRKEKAIPEKKAGDKPFLPETQHTSAGELTEEQAEAEEKKPKKSKAEIAKEKAKVLHKTVAGNVKEAFSGWKTSLDTLYEGITSVFDTGKDASGLGGDSGDIQEVNKVIKELKEADTGGAGITGAVFAGVSSVLKLLKTGKEVGSAIKREFKKDDTNITLDAQERWRIGRGFLHDAADLIGGFGTAFGPISKTVPLYNSIVGLCEGGANMLADVADLITNSIHVHYMRNDRKRIYDRIQEKKEKYSDSGRDVDQRAADAYNVNGSKGIEEKRKELMKKIARDSQNTASGGAAGKIRIINAEDLRSRNDSIYREAIYGLGQRIAETTDKSTKRELEALELMEEYREADKAHKKMRGALLHNVESILKGAAGLIGNGLKLAGEIASLSGVGAAAGAGLITAGLAVGISGTAYDMSRGIGSGIYKGIRTLTGTEDNKATTREDMAISLIQRMEEVSSSIVWTGNEFKDRKRLGEINDKKQLIRQGRNVEHLHSILRRGLDASMTDLIDSESKVELKEKIASSFGQG